MKRIFLIGFMGAGKTTFGKILAKKMKLQFVDLDQEVERRYYKSIAQLFDIHGENGFRIIEQKMLQEVSEFENVVVSTGGGTPCFFNNMQLMNDKGVTVYLKLTVDELLKRTEGTQHSRPLLNGLSGDELKNHILNTLNSRNQFYQQAKITVEEADGENLADVADQLIELINNQYQLREQNRCRESRDSEY
jgi:shikimate kinase